MSDRATIVAESAFVKSELPIPLICIPNHKTVMLTEHRYPGMDL